MTDFDTVIPPGGVGRVTASLDTSHQKGPVTKTVQVSTTPGAGVAVVLELKADVVSAVDVVPENATIRIVVGEPKPATVTVASTDGKPFDVLDVRADPAVAVTIGAAPGSPAAAGSKPMRKGRRAVAPRSSRYQLTITPSADVPIGSSAANVTLTTSLDHAKEVPIHVALFVVGRIRVAPSELVVEAAVPGHVRLSKVGDRGFQILAVDSSDPDFVGAAAEVRSGLEYEVTARYVGAPGRGLVHSQVTVRTDEAGQREIVVPVIGQF